MTYERSQLSDQALMHSLATHVARERGITAELLADIAEVDARKLYLPAAYPSMFAYCVGELRLSEEAAFKRIHAARAARRWPAIFAALADGRLHLSAVVMLAPHLNEHTADDLLAAATHKTKAQIERLLAERFPRPDVAAWVQAIPTASPSIASEQHAPGRVDAAVEPAQDRVGDASHQAPGPAQAPPAPARQDDRSRVAPLAPQRFAVQFTMSQNAHDKLRHAQELLGREVASGDLAQVFERALDALIVKLETRKFAATGRPRPGHRRPAPDSRHIPADVRRAVWTRDQGRCTFVSGNGHRCEARAGLEFDHVEAHARGGEATVSGIRLLCRAHNQLAAERTFGAEFMRHKRLAAMAARDVAASHAATDGARAGAGEESAAAPSAGLRSR